MRLCLLSGVLALACFAEQPHFQDAKLETRSAGGGLEAAVRAVVATQTAPTWIAYAVPISKSNQHLCWSDQRTALMLEGSKTLVVVLKMEEHTITRITYTTGDCEVDVGGLTVYWLDDVRADESVAMLERIAREHLADRASDSASARRRISQSAISAIGLHAGPAAASFFSRTLSK